MQGLVFGDLHGRIRAMYAAARGWEEENGQTVDVLLQVGDFGTFSDPSTLKEEKRERYGPGDYPALLQEGWSAPIPTYFCKGNNEDFEALPGPLPQGLYWVRDGEVVVLGETRVAFLGGGWAPKAYWSDDPKPNYISRTSLERLLETDFEVLICHDAPGGTWLPGRRFPVGSAALRYLIEKRQPRLVVHGHHHQRMEQHIGPTHIVGLDILRPARPASALLPLEL